MTNTYLTFKKNANGAYEASFNEYVFTIYHYEHNCYKGFALDLKNTKTNIMETEHALATLKVLKMMANEMIEARLKDPNYYLNSLIDQLKWVKSREHLFEKGTVLELTEKILEASKVA